MLAYFLATLMATISLTLYLNAFISPKIHRQDDFLWSGLGLFYALTLWVCAGRITGAVLLGQLAIISVAIAFIWENRQLRKTITADSESNTILEGVSLLSLIIVSFGKLSQLIQKKSSVSNNAKSDKFVTNKQKTDIAKETLVTDTENKVSDEIKIESNSIVEEIVSDIDNSQKIENIIEETMNDNLTEELQHKENIIEEIKEIVIKQEKKEENIDQSVDLSLNNSITENNSIEDDFDVDSLGLAQSPSENKPSSSTQTNILTKFLGLFRKSSPQKISQSEEVISPLPSLEDTDLQEEILEIDSKTTAIEVEDAIDNFDLAESNNISEENKSTAEILPETITAQTEEVIETSIKIVTSKTEIIVDSILESKNQEEEEEVDLSTDLDSENQEEEEVDLSTDLDSENQEEEIDLSNDLEPEEINSENISEKDIIETLDDLDLLIETEENANLNVESSSQENNQNPMDELDSLFEDETKN